jgi:hypothetical protein
MYFLPSTEEVTIQELVNCPEPADPDDPDETDYSDQVCGVKYKLDGDVYDADMTKLEGRDTYQRDGETKSFVDADYFTLGQKAYVVQETKKLKREQGEPKVLFLGLGIAFSVFLFILLGLALYDYKKSITRKSNA